MVNLIGILNDDAPFVFRLFIAMILGSLVGMERQSRGRPAGLRTNILVCLGSAAIIVAFQKLSLDMNIGSESIIRMDPARAAAGVITGMGFLGAGTIIKSKDFVRGLTTAASIWVVSAIGVTVGLGEYVIATVLTMLVLFSLYALHHISIASDYYFSLRLKWHGDIKLLDEIIDRLLQEKVYIKNHSFTRSPNTGECNVVLNLRMRMKGRVNTNSVIKELQSDKRFDEVGWI